MWVWNTKKIGSEIHVFIGQVKIAEICFAPGSKKWKVYLRLMLNHVAYDIHDHYESVSAAMKDLHRLLNAPPKE